MTTADDADSSWRLRKNGAAQTLAAEGLVRFGNTVRIVFSHALFVALYAVLFCVLVLSAYKAITLKPESVWRDVAVDASAAIAIFIVAPFLAVATGMKI